MIVRALGLLWLLLASSPGAAHEPQWVTALLQARDAAAPAMAASPFQRPLLLDSTESRGGFEGQVQARLSVPFARLQQHLSQPSRWCELLLLMPNITGCKPMLGQHLRLALALVNAVDTGIEDAHWIEFQLATQTRPNGLRVQLSADEGPVGTRDYEISMGAVPAHDGQSYLQLRYRYRYGLAARLAAQAYLLSSGRGKVGFTVTDRTADGKPRYIEGLRGAVERNVMRCYLAIEALVTAAEMPQPARVERALTLWMAGIAKHPRQLEEPDLQRYREAKRQAYARLLTS